MVVEAIRTSWYPLCYWNNTKQCKHKHTTYKWCDQTHICSTVVTEIENKWRRLNIYSSTEKGISKIYAHLPPLLVSVMTIQFSFTNYMVQAVNVSVKKASDNSTIVASMYSRYIVQHVWWSHIMVIRGNSSSKNMYGSWAHIILSWVTTKKINETKLVG